MNYFSGFKSEEAIKKRYRSLCKILHPDAGGDHRAFIEMKRQYELAITGYHNRYDRHTLEYISVIEELLSVECTNIHLIGSWIWVFNVNDLDCFDGDYWNSGYWKGKGYFFHPMYRHDDYCLSCIREHLSDIFGSRIKFQKYSR